MILRKTTKNLPGVLPRAAILALLLAGLLAFASNVLAQQGSFVPTGSMTTARSNDTATLLNNGTVLVTGTFNDNNGDTLASAELYDPTTGVFTATGSMANARGEHTATLLNNGKVLVAGGIGTTTPTFSALASAELYDPVAGTFTATGSMTSARFSATATPLNNGQVLVAGGASALTLGLASAELYDPTTGVFTATGGMTIARYQHTATLLSNGKVLIAGGGNNSVSNGASAELYDPTTGTFTATGSMAAPRSGDTATLLNNGQVLVVGTEYSELPFPAELYNPATGVFTETGTETNAVDGQTATLLNNGAVLVAGGQFEGSDAGSIILFSSAELYVPVAASPVSLSFSNQPVAMTSASRTITLTNNGTTALGITSITITGANASDFAETDNCVGSLAAGASCSINVSFTPAAAGSRTGSLTIANNLTGNPLAVPLTGTGFTATRIVSFSANSLTFAGQTVGTTSTATALVLNNTGNVALTISSLVVGGTNASDFSESDSCGGNVAAGASCNINVTFSPAATGTRTGTLTITDNATSPPSPQVIPLSGVGQDFSLAASSSQSATITPGQTASYSLTIAPSDGFNQAVGFTCAGAPPEGTCTVTPSSIVLNGSASATIAVTVTTRGASLLVPGAPKRGPHTRVNYRPALLMLVLLGLFLLSRRSKRQRGLRLRPAHGFVLLLLLYAAAAMSGCGGGSSSNSGGGTPTPAGTYPLVVSGTFTSSSAIVTKNTSLTLVVQ